MICSLLTILFVVKWGGFIGKQTCACSKEEFSGNWSCPTVGSVVQGGHKLSIQKYSSRCRQEGGLAVPLPLPLRFTLHLHPALAPGSGQHRRIIGSKTPDFWLGLASGRSGRAWERGEVLTSQIPPCRATLGLKHLDRRSQLPLEQPAPHSPQLPQHLVSAPFSHPSQPKEGYSQGMNSYYYTGPCGFPSPCLYLCKLFLY